MNAALWGAGAALAFGLADFLGRFTGRALGPRTAMLGLMLVGTVLLSLYGLAAGLPVRLPAETAAAALPVLLAAGAAAMVAPLVFYKSLTLGPIALCAPIAAAYPALVVPVEVAFGARPGPLAWAAMAVTLLGTVVVARTAGEDPDAALAADPRNRGRAIAGAAAACALFAVAMLAGRQAVALYGAVPTLWLGRVVGLALLLVPLAAARRRPRIPARWWPVLLLQGVVDALAYLCFYLGSQGGGAGDASTAAVASSAFMVVVVLLGWGVLRERVSPACWAGILLVFGGVATLSAQAS